MPRYCYRQGVSLAANTFASSSARKYSLPSKEKAILFDRAAKGIKTMHIANFLLSAEN